MQFYRLIDKTTPNIQEIRNQNPNVGIPDNPEDLSHLGYEKFEITPKPPVGDYQRAVESGTYTKNSEGIWNIDWKIIDWYQFEIDAHKSTSVLLMWEKIKAERERRAQNGVRVGTYWYHSDSASRIQQLGLKDSAKDILAAGGDESTPITILGQTVYWQSIENKSQLLTVKLAFDIVEAVKELDATLFYVAKNHKAAMEASVNPATYNFSQGWPPTYGD